MNESFSQADTKNYERILLPAQKFVYPDIEIEARAIAPSPVHQSISFETIGFDSDEQLRIETKTAQTFIEQLNTTTALEMVHIPGGRFMMGASEPEGCEEPVHSVTIAPFYLGKYAVTQQQWEQVMQFNLSAHRLAGAEGQHLPVENASWRDATKFCRRLSAMTGRNYRLPSEAEWEYACRAGTTTAYSFGDRITTDLANYWDLEAEDLSKAEPIVLESRPVGCYFPNPFGLYDMHGNVFELCEDAFHDDYEGAPSDGSPWGSGKNAELVVIRGGSFDYYEDECRSAFRSETPVNHRYAGTGFRVACSPTPYSSR